MRRRSQVLEHRICVADPVRRGIEMRRQRRLLVFKHKRADQLRVELDDDRGAAAVLGRDAEGVGDEEVGGEDGLLGDVAGCFGCFKYVFG